MPAVFFFVEYVLNEIVHFATAHPYFDIFKPARDSTKIRFCDSIEVVFLIAGQFAFLCDNKPGTA
ncbi:hypothetical protein D3C80_1065050 [compost metagenome]